MRFTIKREQFLKSLNIANRAISSKSAIAALSNVKLDLTEEGLFVMGSNFEFTIRTFVPYKDNAGTDLIRNYKEGSILLNAKIISEIARKMEAEEITIEIIDSTIATVTDNKSEYKLNCMRAEEYPDVDLDASNGVLFSLPVAQFASMVDQTAFAASTKEQRPILTALNLEAGEGLLTAIATDSARLAKKQIPISSNLKFIANIPAKMMVEIEHLSEGSSDIAISIGDKKALFTFSNTTVVTRLLQGEFPNTSKVIPHGTNYSLEVNAEDLIRAIDRANILSIDRENVVDLSMESDKIEISAKSSQVGSASEKVSPFRYEGQPLQISFNSEFVVAAVKALGSEDVTFSFVGEMRPFVIKNTKDDSVVQVVTPVRTF